jgi:RNA polymerase sigma-70 factor (ECF subfamily)
VKAREVKERMLYWPGIARTQAVTQEHDALAFRGQKNAQSATALTDLYEQYYDRVTRYIAARIGNRDLAEDLAGDVFVRCVESIGSFEQRGVPLQAWLFRVAHNIVIDHYRRNSRRRNVPLDAAAELPGDSQPQEEVEQKLIMDRVTQAIALLNPAQQQVITLRFIAGLSSEEAGAVMGRTNGAIRELQRTALKALRGQLGTDLEKVRFGAGEEGTGEG